jgi:hypothetical protein
MVQPWEQPVVGGRTLGGAGEHRDDLSHNRRAQSPVGTVRRHRTEAGRRAITALLAVPLVLVLAACSSTSRGAPARPVHPGTTVGPLALGVNVAAWDSINTDIGTGTVNDLIRAAGLHVLRFPGGSWADEYDWFTGTDSSHCTGTVSAACSTSDPFAFTALSAQARAVGAASFITVNYSSGSPSEAAGWVSHARTTPGEAVALWEVGNESYSCYEANLHLAEPPTSVKGYTPDGPVCPSTAVMAASYVAHAPAYLDAMKQADPSARIGVPWAFSGTEAQGAGVVDASLWNTAVLRATAKNVAFVDAHWYPFDTTAGLTDQKILLSTRRIPSAAAQIRTTLHRDAPGATFVVGETNISERLSTLDFQPVSALFAAATSLQWLADGAESVVWWDLNNFGSPATGDYGIVSSGNPETEPTGTPFPPYYGEQLASQLTSSGARLHDLATGSPDVLGYQSDGGGLRRVLLVNTRPTAALSVRNRWFTPGTSLSVETYAAATASGPSPIGHSTVRAGTNQTLPAESVVVLAGPRS